MTDSHEYEAPGDQALDWRFSATELADVETLLVALEPGDRDLVELPSDLWSRIEAELGAELVTDAVDIRLVQEPAADNDLAPVIDLSSRRRTPVLAALAAAVLAVLAVGWWQLGQSSETVVASAELAYDDEAFDPLGAEARATAELVDDDGYRLRLADASLPSEEGSDLELWLIKPDDQGGVADLVAVDLIAPGATEFSVPEGYDPEEFSVVDISVEPRDGDATHSGRSILRAPLQF